MKLVVLDENGTLLDALGPFYRSAVAVFSHYGIEAPTIDDYRDNITSDFMQFYWDRGIPLHVTDRDVNRIVAKYHARNEKIFLFNPQPGAKELFLHCVKLGFNVVFVKTDVNKIATCRSQELGIRTLAADPPPLNNDPGQGELLNALASMDEITHGDDDPWEIWCIGDTVREIAIAKSIPLKGIHTIAFTGGFDSPRKFEGLPEKSAPDYVVDSLLDIPFILDAFAQFNESSEGSPLIN